MASFDLEGVLYYLGSKEYMIQFKKQFGEILDIDVNKQTAQCFAYHNIELSPFSIGFVLHGLHNPDTKGKLTDFFRPALGDLADGSDDAICICCLIKEYTSSGMNGFGCAFEQLDWEGDCDVSKWSFTPAFEDDAGNRYTEEIANSTEKANEENYNNIMKPLAASYLSRVLETMPSVPNDSKKLVLKEIKQLNKKG